MRIRTDDTAAIAALLITCLLARVATLGSLDLTDPSEGRFASAAVEMQRGGDWSIPKIHRAGQGWVPYLAKPPLQIWCMASAFAIFGASTWSARLPGFLASSITLCALMLLARRFRGPRHALLAGLVFATSAGGFFLGSAAITDPGLLACVSVGVVAVALLADESDPFRKRAYAYLCAASAGLGMLVKGPICPLLIGLIASAWLAGGGRWRRLSGLPALFPAALFFALWLPWYMAAEASHPGFLRYFLIDENLLRYLSPDSQIAFGSLKTRPRGSIVPMFALLALPWIFLAPRMAARGTAPRAPLDDWRALLWCWLLIPLLFFCCARSVLPTYALPALPPFCLLAAEALAHRSEPRLARRIGAASLAVYLLALLAAGTHLNARISSGPVFRWLAETRRTPAAAEVAIAENSPGSAWFYARSLPESVLTVYEEDRLGQDGARLPGRVVLKSKRLDRLPAALRDRIEILYRDAGWIVAREPAG